jgi:cbb3-type cytochrome oxidase subunit 3
MNLQAILHWLQQYSIVPVFVVFVALLVITYWPGRRKRFERDARIPFDDDR